jgi:UPF0755 protein
LLGGLILSGVALSWLGLPPAGFPIGRVVVIEPGWSLARIAGELEAAKVITSPRLFTLAVRGRGGEGGIRAGYYEFDRPLNVLTLSQRLVAGQFAVDAVKVTFPEGYSAEEMADRLAPLLPNFDRSAFLESAAQQPGLLFPDTYFLPSHISSDQLVAIFHANALIKLRPLEGAITDSGRSLEEIINLAAIVEEEVSDPTDRRLVAGVLLKRLDAGGRLEVDVEPGTYEYTGLPPAPITNPGLDAIRAVLEPTASDYWFYLSAEDGTTYYAETFTAHKQNIQKYLR